MFIKQQKLGVEVALQLGALAALSVNLGLVPNIHHVQLTSPVVSVSGDLMLSSGLCRHCATYVVQTACIQGHTYIH